MPISSRAVADGYMYDIVDRELPKLGPDGAPTDETVHVKVLIVQDGQSAIEIVFLNEPDNPDWDRFVERCQGARVAIANSGDLARLPTIEQITRPLGNGHR